MRCEWKTVRIGDICKTNMASYSENDNWDFINYLDTGNITNNYIDEIQYLEKSKDKYPSRARRKVNINDIVYSTVRPNQRHFGIIKSIPDNFLVSTGFTVITVDKNVVDADFIYYYLTQNDIIESLHSIGEQSTSAYPSIKPSDIESIEIKLPPLNIQIEISAILRTLDDKIELNKKINDNLDKQAQAIFKSWFVDFEPFGGVMPKDWIIAPLSEIAEFVSGYSYKGNELIESNIAMATIKNFDRKGGFKLDGYKEIVPSSKLKTVQYANLFDTLVAHTDLTQNAEIVGNAELVMSKSGYENIIFSMDLVKVLPKSEKVSKFLIAALLRDEMFKAHCLGYVNGTTVLHLSKKALPEYQLALPNNLSVLKPLDEVLTVLYKIVSINIEESMRLSILRDSMLAKLMSGELDVSEIDL